MKFFLLTIFVALPHFIQCDTTKDKENYQSTIQSSTLYCNDLNPQSTIDFNMLFGFWYGAEIITHHESGEEYEHTYDSCVVVHLSDADKFDNVDYDYTTYDERNTDRRNQPDQRRNQHSYNNFNQAGANRKLRLVWEERGKSLTYLLRVDSARRGFWISSGQQKGEGTMLELPYNQFTGTVQVMKAVGNHLVLTFCDTLPKSQIFTVILTRKLHLLSRDDVQSVRNLLRRRGLNVQSVRKVCRNSSTTQQFSIIMLIALTVVSLLSRTS